jgi:hypothetical protein
MLDKINHVKKAMEAGSYQAALALALTIPDICGQNEFPNNRVVAKRYTDWCDKFVNFGDSHIGFGTEAANIDGALLYAIRCAFLHSGNDDINTQRASNKISITDLKLLKPEQANSFNYQYIVSNNRVETSINMEYLSNIICSAAISYYNSLPNKSNLCNLI